MLHAVSSIEMAYEALQGGGCGLHAWLGPEACLSDWPTPEVRLASKFGQLAAHPPPYASAFPLHLQNSFECVLHCRGAWHMLLDICADKLASPCQVQHLPPMQV